MGGPCIQLNHIRGIGQENCRRDRAAAGIGYQNRQASLVREPKALEKVVALPQDEQDAIASQILASLADEEAWKKRFDENRDVIRRMAREAVDEDERAATLPLDDLL